ncbi:oxygen-independent coproporphyrinogen III oxidase [uncultured Sulfitobacter sp.]|uniref:oxygen-independent coproporphyrinogen III oxidase n=1 Tax=uncultured Sulfitobacter sp. TaxID=191468 RepID=UPI002627B833|nr:oxygen-independent coproporphyrinogen III oxidase [uncultured Sulfitobacter sp.]
MENLEPLIRHGLFDAKVPRYTSYPPANHFENGIGRRHQLSWLSSIEEGEDVSIYIHIPFCKRLCWFCACRTQGTQTMRPVEAYIDIVLLEIAAAIQEIPKGTKMGRLHLGGGTPTILTPRIMSKLLDAVFDAFAPSADFEFSVEIDPTEASPELLGTLVDYGMNRASIGVQDFDPKVQAAIGRMQSLEQTTAVVEFLRGRGVDAINLDLLYGLPFQTQESFRTTLDHVIAMDPDRLAIYGYAHVPWMSKRQVLIKEETLPDTMARFDLANIAHNVLTQKGFEPVGIDHFAKKTDSLYKALQTGGLRRNFQGYTDDPSATLIGFGASAISRFKEGYQQNAPATSAYQERVLATGFAGHKGYLMTPTDDVVAAMIEELMCRFSFPTQALQERFPDHTAAIRKTAVSLMSQYPDVFRLTTGGLEMLPETYALVRVVASYVDTFTAEGVAHAAAI